VKRVLRVLLRFFVRIARPYLRAYGLLQTAKIFNRSALVFDPGGERVLVLAPHMDDEVIGCGGTLALHVARGADVTVTFLTDGRRAGALAQPPGAREPLDIVATRKHEAHRALGELGVDKIVFFDVPDGELGNAVPRLADKLRKQLQRLRPSIVYLPFFLEEL
jgi:N-acetylglucosamine malate deacetylase 1